MKTQVKSYKRKCPNCSSIIIYSSLNSFREASKKDRVCRKCSNLNKNKATLEEYVAWCKSELIRQNVNSYKKLDKSNWPSKYPKTKSPYPDFKESMTTDKQPVAHGGKVRSKEEHIKFYREEVENQQIKSFKLLDKSNWPFGIAKNYRTVGISWGNDVTASKSFVAIGNETKEELLKWLRDNKDVILYLNGLDLVICLSKLTDKKIGTILGDSRKLRLLKATVNKISTMSSVEEKEELYNSVVDSIENKTSEEIDEELKKVSEFEETTDATFNNTEESVDNIYKVPNYLGMCDRIINNENIDFSVKELLKVNTVKFLWKKELDRMNKKN